MSDPQANTAPEVAAPVQTKEQIAAEAKAKAEAEAAAKAAKFQQIKEAFQKVGQLVDVKDASFKFKEVKLTDDQGKETGETFKRAQIDVGLPVPSLEGLLEILSKPTDADGKPNKAFDLVFESLQNTVADQGRDLINDDENITTDNFPYDKLSWEYIANLPKAERRGGGIAAEVWKDFAADYIAVMPAPTGKSVEMVTRAANLFLGKLNQCKTNKLILSKLKGQLAIYLQHTSKAEEFAKCVEFLDKKADALLAIKDEDAAQLI